MSQAQAVPEATARRSLRLAFVGTVCVLIFLVLPMCTGGINVDLAAARVSRETRAFFSSFSGLGSIKLGGPVNYWETGFREYWLILAFSVLATYWGWKRDFVLMCLATWGAAIFSLVTLWVVYSRLDKPSGTLSVGWLVLFCGVGCLIVAASAPALARRQQKAATRPTTGRCPICGTVNPLTFTKCHHCFAFLPWAKVASAKPKKAPRAIQLPRMGMSAGDVFSMIDWAWWLVVLISLAMPPVGLMLYLAYTRNDDDKAGAAALGGLSGLALFILRFWWIMYKASQPLTP